MKKTQTTRKMPSSVHPQASAGTPNNTRELAQIDKKKPQLITVGASVLVADG
jgi:hypothetical protein